MSLRIDSTGDSASRSTNLPDITNFTMMGWFRLAGSTSFGTLLCRGTTWATYLNVGLTGTVLIYYDSTNSGGEGGSDLGTNTWHHITYTRSGVTRTIYFDGVQNVQVTNTAPTVASDVISIGNNGDAENMNGSAAAIKIWGAALTVAEIQQEMRQYLPVRTANINSFNPFNCPTVASNNIDYSGNGFNLTFGGTLTFEDGPPIAWSNQGNDVIYIPAIGGGEIIVNATPVSTTLSTVAPLLEKHRLETPNTVTISNVTANLQIQLSTTPNTVTLANVAPSNEKHRLESPIDLTLSSITPLLQLELNTSPTTVTISNVAPSLQLEYNAAPIELVIIVVSPAIGQSVVVDSDVVTLTLSVVTPLFEKHYSILPNDVTLATVTPNLQLILGITPNTLTLSTITSIQSLEVNIGVNSLTVTTVTPLLEHQINVEPSTLLISVVDVTTSHDVPINLPVIEVTPEPIEAKNSLFAAFNERIKYLSGQPIVSEFVLEDTSFPYISLHQVYNVLAWKNSCLERFEEANFRISVYAEDGNELEELVKNLQQHLTYHTLLLNPPKQLIQLEQLEIEREELIPQLFRAQLLYQTIVQRGIDQTYILSPTSGETLNRAIYNRFKELPLSKRVHDLVSPGYALENTNYPYLVVPVINEKLDWRHSLGRIDRFKYPINVYSEDLNELTELIDEVERSYDYATFNITDKNHLINEWVGTDIVEVQPQLWCGKVNYEILVESSISNFRDSMD